MRAGPKLDVKRRIAGIPTALVLSACLGIAVLFSGRAVWNVQLRPTTTLIIQEDISQSGFEAPLQALQPLTRGPISPPPRAGPLSSAVQTVEDKLKLSTNKSKNPSSGGTNSTAVQGFDMLLQRLHQCKSFECLKTVQLELVGRARFNVPHFFLIGWQKCATSSIYNHLRRHPEFLAAPKKEPHFFTGCQRSWDYRACHARSDEHYIKEFLRLNEAVQARLESATADASVDYAWKGEPLARKLHEMFPWLKIVMVMREPIARMISYSRMFTQRGGIFAHKGCQDGQSLFDCLYWRFDYNESHYDTALEGWLQVFPPEQIHVMQFEVLQENPEAQLLGLKKFLGLNPELPDVPLRNVNSRRVGTGYPITRKQYSSLVKAVRPRAEHVATLLQERGLANGTQWIMRWQEIWQRNLDACDGNGQCFVDSRR